MNICLQLKVQTDTVLKCIRICKQQVPINNDVLNKLYSYFVNEKLDTNKN